MIHFVYDIPSNPSKCRQRTFHREAEMRAYITALHICYGGNFGYCWSWTTLEAQRSNGFNT